MLCGQRVTGSRREATSTRKLGGATRPQETGDGDVKRGQAKVYSLAGGNSRVRVGANIQRRRTGITISEAPCKWYWRSWNAR